MIEKEMEGVKIVMENMEMNMEMEEANMEKKEREDFKGEDILCDNTSIMMLLEDDVHLPKNNSLYLPKTNSPCLLKTTRLYHVEPQFNITEKEKGKGQKALDSKVNQFGALVREAEDNKQLLVNSIL